MPLLRRQTHGKTQGREHRVRREPVPAMRARPSAETANEKKGAPAASVHLRSSCIPPNSSSRQTASALSCAAVTACTCSARHARRSQERKDLIAVENLTMALVRLTTTPAPEGDRCEYC